MCERERESVCVSKSKIYSAFERAYMRVRQRSRERESVCV